MGQENQLQTQVYVLRRPFRATTYGGRDETHVFMLKENVVVEIEPRYSFRSRSGRHGEDVWMLKSGKYLVVDITRPNKRANPYSITVWCYDISGDGTATKRELASFYEDTVDMALMRAKELVYQCVSD
jgi:hypothetical protein